MLHAAADYLAGYEILGLPEDRVPGLDAVNSVLAAHSGWQALRTRIRYEDAGRWYDHLARKEFLVTDYMRAPEELDFTPEPDMFHDVFGHLPFMVHPRHGALQVAFARAYLQADARRREEIQRLAWFSIEFGLIRENGRTKIFGAGLLSSAAELDGVVAGAVSVLPFTIENVLCHDKATLSQNEVLFEFPSLEVLEAELSRYFENITPRSR